MHYYCTLFDRNYLLKGIVMLRTLARHYPASHIFVLCLDDLTYDLLGKLAIGQISRIRLEEIEDDALRAAKLDRTIAEYCWTLAPCLSWYVLQDRPGISQITYLDADLMFFSSVQPLHDEIGDASIAIIEHRYVPRLAHLEGNCRFNVEWVSFQNDPEGMACLARWKEQCLAWCYHRLEDGKMGDQKYLDTWPTDYSSVCIIQHKGAGVAPWNYANYTIAESPAGIFIDGTPLIFYHFHQFTMLRGMGGRYHYMSPGYTLDKPIPLLIYKAYERELQEALRDVRRIAPDFQCGIRPALPVKVRSSIHYVLQLPLRCRTALARLQDKTSRLLS